MWYYESLKVMNDEVLKSRFDSLKVGNKFRKNENFLLALSFWHGREAETLCSQMQGYISITKSIMLKVQMFRLPPQTLGWVFGTHILKPFRWGSRRSSPRTWKQTNNVSWEQRLSLKRQMGVVFNDPQTFCAEECKILPSDNLLAPPKNPRNHVSAERSKVQDQHSQSHFYMLTMNT